MVSSGRPPRVPVEDNDANKRRSGADCGTRSHSYRASQPHRGELRGGADGGCSIAESASSDDVTISVADRAAAITRALVRLADLCGDARSIRFGEGDLVDAAPFRTTINELRAVRAAFTHVKASIHVTELKSARSRRTIALPAVAVTALRSHRVRQLEARLATGGRWQDRTFVFTSAVGTPLEPRDVTRQFKALLALAKLPNIRLPICGIRARRCCSLRV